MKYQGCKIDEEFLPIVSVYKWHIDNYGYAISTEWCKKFKKTGIRIKMHRLILGVSDPKIRVDHINGVKSDNRVCNLRLSSHAQNLWNSPKSKNNKSGYKGVCMDKRRGTWKAEISSNRVRIYLGDFKSPEQAALVWNKKALELHGEFAFQNKVRRKV